MRTQNAGFVSSNCACVTFKAPLVRRATGNHLIKSNSLEGTYSPISLLLLRSKSRMLNAIAEENNRKPPHKIHFPRKNSEPYLWLLASFDIELATQFLYFSITLLYYYTLLSSYYIILCCILPCFLPPTISMIPVYSASCCILFSFFY